MGTDHGLKLDDRRRRFVLGGLRLIPALVLLPVPALLSGCNGQLDNKTNEPLTIPLTELPLGERVRLENDGAPVEFMRLADGIVARSLLCTHQGCRVRWHEDQQLYICPCHDGKYDAAGDVVYGMPTRPLRKLQVSVQGELVVVTG